MECFRIDESGYTGFDLLNAEQRFQGAAAIAITDQDAARLISEHFPKLQAPELKYRALSRRPANHPRLLSLQRDLALWSPRASPGIRVGRKCYVTRDDDRVGRDLLRGGGGSYQYS
jgi:hypothetical protein